MRARLVLAFLAAAALLAPVAAPAAGPTRSAAALPVASPQRYLADILDAKAGFERFNARLQATSGPDDVKAQVAPMRRDLHRFDAAVRRLRAYRLRNARLERQRVALARTGPRVAKDFRVVLDAAVASDLRRLTAILPELLTAARAFVTAANTK
jgi:hypothetical protein